MLIELLKIGSVDLSRRWLAALLLVPEAEREKVVRAVEGRIVEVYDRPEADGMQEDREIVVRYPAVQREGYVEEVVKTYEVRDGCGTESAKGEDENRPRRVGGA